MSALTPRPGIMKIAPYVPGKDSVEGKKTIAKLSSNEGALGPSPKAMAAYAKAAIALGLGPSAPSFDDSLAIVFLPSTESLPGT